MGRGDGRAHCSLIGRLDVCVPVVSSRFSWHDLSPWQPLPPSIHGHLYFELIQEKLPRLRQRGDRRIRAENAIDDAVCVHT